MENRENHQFKQDNSMMWRETEKGEFIPCYSYDDTLHETEGDTLNDIEWKKVKFAKKNLSKVKLESLKPGDLVYHRTHGYVKLERNQATETKTDDGFVNWECSVVHANIRSNEEKKAEEKLNISSKEFEFYIYVEIAVQVEKKVGSSHSKVNINDKINTLIEPMEYLYNSQLLPIFNGQQIDQLKSFAEEGVKDSDKIYLYGLQGKFETKNAKVKFYKRYRDVRVGDSWYVGRDRWDAIIFIPSKAIRVFGVGIFEQHPDGGEFTLGYKYHLEESNGSEISSSAVFEETINPPADEVQDHIIKYKFQNLPKGIEVKAGQRFNICMWLTASRCYYSETGENYTTIENEDKDLFEIKDSTYCTNSTRTNRGIIPGILYSL